MHFKVFWTIQNKKPNQIWVDQGSEFYNKFFKNFFKFFKMSQYVPPHKISGRNSEVELDLSNYATKTVLKNVTHVYFSGFASKTR